MLGRHPLVRQVVCRGEPHDLLGLIVVAEVVPEGPFPDAEATLRRHCDDHLEAQAVPREIRLIDRLPVSASGKADLSAVSPGG